jgi:hypothetical protein
LTAPAPVPSRSEPGEDLLAIEPEESLHAALRVMASEVEVGSALRDEPLSRANREGEEPRESFDVHESG